MISLRSIGKLLSFAVCLGKFETNLVSLFFSLSLSPQNRKGKNDKDGLVNALLDFLGEPSEALLKGSKKKPETNHVNKKAKSRAVQQEDEEEETVQFGQMPSDQQVQTWARHFTKVYNMEKATIKVALEVAGDKFGVDMKEKKSLLKEYLAEAQS